MREDDIQGHRLNDHAKGISQINPKTTEIPAITSVYIQRDFGQEPDLEKVRR